MASDARGQRRAGRSRQPRWTSGLSCRAALGLSGVINSVTNGRPLMHFVKHLGKALVDQAHVSCAPATAEEMLLR